MNSQEEGFDAPKNQKREITQDIRWNFCVFVTFSPSQIEPDDFKSWSMRITTPQEAQCLRINACYFYNSLSSPILKQRKIANV